MQTEGRPVRRGGRARGGNGAATGAAAGGRRAEILAVATSIFARRGITNTTVRDIGEETGILSGSLYHHFSSKEEMLEEIIRAALDPDIELDLAVAHSDADPVEAVRELVLRAMRFQHHHADVAAIIANGRHELGASERFDFLRARTDAIRTAWLAVLERGVAEGAFRADLDVDLAYKAAMGAITSVAHWYRPDGDQSIDEIAAHFTTLFLAGFVAHPPA